MPTDSDVYREAVEIAARAGHEASRALCHETVNLRVIPEFDVAWDDLPDDVRDHLIRCAEASVSALLAPRPCKNEDCRDGWVPWGSGDPWVEEGSDPCPSCAGSGVGLPLVVERDRLEQVGWFTPSLPDNGPNIGPMADGKFDDDDEPVFRLVIGESPNDE